MGIRGQPKEIPTASPRPQIFSNTLSGLNVDTSASPTSLPPGAANSSEHTPLDGITRTVDHSLTWSKTRKHVTQLNLPHVAAPWEHKVLERDNLDPGASDTVRDFSYRRQRRRMIINGLFQWALTVSICAALVAILYRYSNFQGLSQSQKHTFNALVTGLSLSLGLSLASSLRSYALMMRWRLLTTKYRTLKDFELVLACDDQMKVLRLLWTGRNQGRWWIPNKTQVLCFIWLVINIALQVLTALLGLTYSVEVSMTHLEHLWGNVSIADLSNINTWGYKIASFADQAGIANTYGIEGENYYQWVNPSVADQVYLETYYSNTDNTTFWYRFQDQNPNNFYDFIPSNRTVSATAHCDQFKVLSGGDSTQSPYVTYFDTNLQQNVTQRIHTYALGCSTWMSNMNVTCGPRCTNVMMLLTANNRTGSVPFPLWFSCNNTVSQVTNIDTYDTPAKYMLPDEQARAWAGAIGFNGITFNGTDLQYVLYEYDSDFSLGGYPNNDPGTAIVEQDLMAFTAEGLAATDVNGPRLNVSGYYPTQAQVVDVEWEWTIALLAGIPVCQFLVLLAVLISVDKVIIKDHSHLATARLLRSVVEKLGDKGCLLTGDEIAEALGNYKLKYGVRDPPESSLANDGHAGNLVRHVDVIEEMEGLGRADARGINGLYDGTNACKLRVE